MAKIHWSIATLKTTGEKLVYLYKDAWQVRYYSFDNEKSWHPSKTKAYKEALASGNLSAVMDMNSKHFCVDDV